ncbi:unnamed protein product [Auanema sp. JU1783]|nr:unnamed protein product [Auanema sp. JU1783]
MLSSLFLAIHLATVVHINAVSSFQSNFTILPRISPDDIIQNLIKTSYDRRIRPPNINDKGENKPVNVETNAYIRSFSNIDFVKMQYDVQLTFRQAWHDSRLAYNYRNGKIPKFMIITRDDLIWKPDTFFLNEKNAFRHNIDSPNMLLRIYANGSVLYSQRISLTLSCPMLMKRYPMDKQSCDMAFASYAYSEDEIVYNWKHNDSIQLHKALRTSLPCFTLYDFETNTCTSKTNTGTYSCLKVTFNLHRQFSYYMLQVYIPSTLLVIVSWISFWLERTAVPARITLGVTSLLTMTTQAASIQNSLPAVSYVKAIDIWLGSCMSFIFAAVLEFAWVSVAASKFAWVSVAASSQETREGKTKSCNQHGELQSPDSGIDKSWHSKLGSKDEEEEEDNALLKSSELSEKKPDSENKQKQVDESRVIDLVARKVFPLMFIIFQISYWTWYSTLD